jgi:hypothetical protein
VGTNLGTAQLSSFVGDHCGRCSDYGAVPRSLRCELPQPKSTSPVSVNQDLSKIRRADVLENEALTV